MQRANLVSLRSLISTQDGFSLYQAFTLLASLKHKSVASVWHRHMIWNLWKLSENLPLLLLLFNSSKMQFSALDRCVDKVTHRIGILIGDQLYLTLSDCMSWGLHRHLRLTAILGDPKWALMLLGSLLWRLFRIQGTLSLLLQTCREYRPKRLLLICYMVLDCGILLNSREYQSWRFAL